MKKWMKISIAVLVILGIGGIYYYKNVHQAPQPQSQIPNINSMEENKGQLSPTTTKETENITIQQPSQKAITENKSDNKANSQNNNSSANNIKVNDITNTENKEEINKNKVLPMLIDLGASTCIPCKMMAPILEEIKKEYEGKAIVKIIDVYESEDEVDKYNIRVIPTQIFINSDGKEVYRNEGIMSKEQITAKFKEMGVE